MKHLGLLIVLALLTSPIFGQILGDPIVHWDFAEGIPADFINTGPGEDAQWEYRGPDTTPDISVCSQGSCSGDFDPIQSESQDNGFVIFDSAFWDDNDGTCDGVGGPYEGPHEAILETAPVDLSLSENAIFTFQQFVRHYQCTTTVSMSVDGGMTWDQLHDNGGWYVIGPNDEWVSYNISEAAVGQEDVRFRFRFIGDHYWWCLDDIAVYEPNANDVQLLTSTYTLFDFNQEPDGYGDIEYSIYPDPMLSPLNIRSKVKNIGGLPQTGVTLNVEVTRDGSEILNALDGPSDMEPSESKNFSLSPWTPPGVGEYEISYQFTQDQVDENLTNNSALRNFSVHPHQYGRDDGITEGQYLGVEIFEEAEFFMGSIYESRESGLMISSIGFALGDSTTVGATVTGRLLSRDSTDVILAETEPYVVNLWDLNSVGEDHFVWLNFTEPVMSVDTSLYFAVVHHPGGENERARIAQSGIPPIETTILSYPETLSLFYMPTTPMVRLGIFSAGETPGCTDASAMNFDMDADVDNGSCRYEGCTITYAENYDPSANFDDGTCIVFGCSDPAAVNYDEYVTEEDGSCLYGGCTNPDAENYDPEANVDDGSCIVNGCTDLEADNYNPDATDEDGSCIYLGCTDPEANNYDETANQDDGSCEYLGCTNPDADNYDPDANVDDGSCIVSGCTDEVADNYNPDANNDDGSCIYLGCTDPEADNYDEQANEDDGSCQYLGCTDPNALNYDPDSNTDDGSCQYAEAFFTLSDTVGCAPFELIITNATAISEGGMCSWDFDNGNTTEDCIISIGYVYTEAGTFTISYEYTISDVTTTYSLDFTVYPEAVVPVAEFDTDTDEVYCTNCPVDADIEWYLDGEPYGETSDSFVVTENGDYSIFLIDVNGCAAMGDTINVIVVGHQEIFTAPFVAYPNPAQDHLTIRTPRAEGGLRMIDLQGRVVISGHLATGQSQLLDVSGLSSGMYVLEWHFGESRSQIRVEIQR